MMKNDFGQSSKAPVRACLKKSAYITLPFYLSMNRPMVPLINVLLIWLRSRSVRHEMIAEIKMLLEQSSSLVSSQLTIKKTSVKIK